jgi:hypothetical protein
MPNRISPFAESSFLSRRVHARNHEAPGMRSAPRNNSQAALRASCTDLRKLSKSALT